MIHQAQAGDVILQVSLLRLHNANFRCKFTQLRRHRIQWLQEHITRLWIHLPTSCLDEASLQLFQSFQLLAKEVSAMPQAPGSCPNCGATVGRTGNLEGAELFEDAVCGHCDGDTGGFFGGGGGGCGGCAAPT